MPFTFQMPADGQLTRFERVGPDFSTSDDVVVPVISRRTATEDTATSTRSGSNCVPLHFCSSATTTSNPSRFLYGLSVVMASTVSEIRMIREANGIDLP